VEEERRKKEVKKGKWNIIEIYNLIMETQKEKKRGKERGTGEGRVGRGNSQKRQKIARSEKEKGREGMRRRGGTSAQGKPSSKRHSEKFIKENTNDRPRAGAGGGGGRRRFSSLFLLLPPPPPHLSAPQSVHILSPPFLGASYQRKKRERIRERKWRLSRSE